MAGVPGAPAIRRSYGIARLSNRQDGYHSCMWLFSSRITVWAFGRGPHIACLSNAEIDALPLSGDGPARPM